MRERLTIALASAAALGCAAVVLYLMVQIDRTRLLLQRDGVLEFNFIQQNDHNFDQFAHALLRWQLERRDDPDAPREWLTRFDIIWSAMSIAEQRWRDVLGSVPDTPLLLGRARGFIERAEPLMRADAVLSDSDIERLAEEARTLSLGIYELGLDMYRMKTRLRDDVVARMDALTAAFRFFGATLVLAGIALFALLMRAYRRASSLVEVSRATERQLTAALEELTDGDLERRRQNRFIATTSHDLRQPLHALGLYLTTLRGHVAGERGQRILDNASRSTESLSQMLGSVLEVSRLDAEVIEVRHEDVDLDALLEDLHGTFLPEAQERALAFDVDLPALTVRSDRVLLERILANLISNALRYTAEGGVSVFARREGDDIILAVEDSGAGIPEREREAVFDEYYQIEPATANAGAGVSRLHGLGLGLSIVRRLTRLLGHEIVVSTGAARPADERSADGWPGTGRPAAGRGTRFELRLPRSDHAAAVPPVTPASPTPLDGVHFDGLTVLVIDDDRDIRDSMHLLLEQRSCRVIAVESAHEARAAIVAEEIVPDIIVADYRLRNGQTGARAITEVRDEVNEDVPAMIVTGDTSPVRLREANASGFRLLHKPVVPEELFDAIGELAGKEMTS